MTAAPKAALVTGAARRVGREIARGLARDGWAVALHHNHSAGEAAEVQAEIRAAGGRAELVQADLSDLAATQGLVAAAVKAVGPLSLLVNNASLFEHDEIETMTPESWAAHIDINLRAPALLSQG
ncbi:MAG: SDR family NAD(P)-dependent oxidoreductase, partial [Parvibaculum sp.]